MRKFLCLIPVITMLCACSGRRPQLNRRLSLWRKDEIPYGTRVAFDALPRFFPDGEVSVNKSGRLPAASIEDSNRKFYIIICPQVAAGDEEITWLTNFVGAGNQVFISANHVSASLMHHLGLRASMFGGIGFQPDSLTVGVYDPADARYHKYSYPGDSYDNWVTSLDSQYTSILGRDHEGRPDFVRIRYKGGGAIYLHLAPLAFSNFFLLHKQNMSYYAHVLSYAPSTVKAVVWDDYFRYDRSSSGFPLFSFIFNSRALTWAFWLVLALFLILYLFDSKRRQRMIPLLARPRNTSLDFVRTIGQLYYQRRDNHNLAMKMAVHFQEQVRTRYHLSIPLEEEGFVDRLAYRTGYPKSELESLVGYVRQLPSKASVPDEQLLEFHRQLEAFYKHS